jgi:hypothetical protein
MDEVDVNLNPKVGCQWMKRGQQAAVETPGSNEKRYLAGSIHWRTGRVVLTEGKPKEGRSAALFLRHLDDLRRAFRQYKVIHVLCDNAGTHTAEGSKLVRAYLKEWGHPHPGGQPFGQSRPVKRELTNTGAGSSLTPLW